MKLTHVTLATVSGFALLLIIAGVYYTNNYTQYKNEKKEIQVKQVLSSEGAIEKQEDSVRAGATLDLHGQGLREVPQYVFQRVGIEKLDLSNNELSGALQAEVRYLSNLKILNLSNNSFTGVPAEIGQLSNLEVLNLAHNNLTGLPYELGNLQNLKTLDLRGNAYSQEDVARIQAELPSTTKVLVD